MYFKNIYFGLLLLISSSDPITSHEVVTLIKFPVYSNKQKDVSAILVI